MSRWCIIAVEESTTLFDFLHKFFQSDFNRQFYVDQFERFDRCWSRRMRKYLPPLCPFLLAPLFSVEYFLRRTNRPRDNRVFPLRTHLHPRNRFAEDIVLPTVIVRWRRFSPRTRRCAYAAWTSSFSSVVVFLSLPSFRHRTRETSFSERLRSSANLLPFLFVFRIAVVGFCSRVVQLVERVLQPNQRVIDDVGEKRHGKGNRSEKDRF